MAKSPDEPRDPAKHARRTRRGRRASKAHRPDSAPTDPALERLLNPGIAKGTAGMGSGTGLQPPPDNSFDRRADFAATRTPRASRRRRASTRRRSAAMSHGAPLDINAELANALGYGESDPNKTLIGEAPRRSATRFPTSPSRAARSA